MMRAHVAILWLCFLPACLGLAREAPDKQTFALELTRDATPAAGDAVVVQVEPFRVAPLFADRAFVYRVGPHTYESDFYNEFLARPEEMLTDLSRAWLQAAGWRVIAPGSRVPPAFFLEVEVDALFGDYRDPAAARAVLATRVTLVHARDGAIAIQRAYRTDAPLADDSRASLAAGWSEALRQVLERLENDLRPFLG